MTASIFLSLPVLLGGVVFGQVMEFNSISGVNSATSESLDGFAVADQFGSQQYSGYVGEMALLFANPGDVTGGTGTPEGTFIADGTYSGVLGLVVFCIDSSTGFRQSGSPSQIYEYRAHSWQAAELRYLNEGVQSYLAGGLKRAAYLIERYYPTAHAGGDLEAAALQAAIWEVLTDGTPNLATGAGTYFVRNSTGNTTLDLRSNQIIALTDQWFAEAEADGWGGAGYDPEDRVAFWLDPGDTQWNQSVISLNPDLVQLVSVPEPEAALLLMMGAAAMMRRRR